MIALGGALGVGLLLASGKAFSIAGPLGTLIGFSLAGCIVLSTMLSFCEIVTVIPLVGGVSGIGSRFVDDAFGFALGVIYWLNYTISLPSEITAAAIMLSYYPHLKVPGSITSAWISFFLIVIISINLFDVRVYGEIEFYSSIFKLLFLLGMIFFSIVLNAGGVAPLHKVERFTFWKSSESEPSKGLTYGPFRPTFDITDQGTGSLDGIKGGGGRLLGIMVAALVASYAYVGTEIVSIAAGESLNPRKSLPKATNKVFWRILIFYVLAIFCVGLNFYSGDPRLLRYYTIDKPDPNHDYEADKIIEQNIIDIYGGKHCDVNLLEWDGFSNGNQSPWVIALQSASLCSFASVLNGILVFFALSAGSSQLYASSRTLYQLSLQGKVPEYFSKCNRHGIPYRSVIFSGIFGSLAFLAVQHDSGKVFQRFMSLCSTAGMIVWAGMCLSFLRYYYGLKQRDDLISRDSDFYPYKSPFQPYNAYVGMFGGIFVVVSAGFVFFLPHAWNTLYFFTTYGSLMLFILCYFGYKYCYGTKILRLDQIQLDIGRKENDKIFWEENRAYSKNLSEKIMKFLHYF
ncbi:uncharacterized protein ASCRUDRAFT_78923 [Ascoidea rubescens DSM 1968]|uniref:Amino acid permease/ SLC12A domain-containing protein n=1 Tax=Ascoidea rubescens DSM 1968 TaxID=1344418 RepID=A0A1D2VQW8_9ASCO|nr:hypothetical protein ASCRUDRAFT_78923 [Ascoidea rubescens DSM 1968]ODV63957.1 hypothetical protein ASCRUDRAFT_78923 [Ascoidea rubescens DSM 1968]